MRPTPFAPGEFERFKQEYSSALHGTKKKVLETWAQRLGLKNPLSLQNLVRQETPRKPSIEKLAPQKEEYAIKITALFNRMPFSGRTAKRVAWSRVIRLAEELGQIPVGSLTPREMGHFARRFRLVPKYRVTGRFRRTTPNSLHQLDFSRSLIFAPAGSRHGIPILQVLSKHQVPYLNKPQDGARVWIGAVKDDASGLLFMRYYLARGEGNEQAIQLMKDAWEQKPDYPFCGVPQAQYRDNARWGKTQQIKRLLGKLGVQDITTSGPGEPWKKGKVEREFATIKHQFENELGATLGKGELISLADANTKLALACMEINMRAHPDYEGYTRLSYWREKVKDTWFPENFDELAYQQHHATVRHRIIRFKSAKYWAPPDVPDGRKVELVVLFGDVFLFQPGDSFGPARRIRLDKAKLNQNPPGDPEAERVLREITAAETSITTIPSEDYDTILLNRLGEDVDFTPPPASARHIEGAGKELLKGRAQREVLAAVLGDLGDLDPLTQEWINKFCVNPHPRDEIERFARRVQNALNQTHKQGVYRERENPEG